MTTPARKPLMLLNVNKKYLFEMLITHSIKFNKYVKNLHPNFIVILETRNYEH